MWKLFAKKSAGNNSWKGGKDAQIIIFIYLFGGGRWTSLILRGGENNILLIFYFFAGGTLSQVQSTNNWYESSNLIYNLIQTSPH